MNYERRGLAVIFNHENFCKSTGYNSRIGTEVDLERLLDTFKRLEFTTKHFNDLTRKEIFQELKNGEQNV